MEVANTSTVFTLAQLAWVFITLVIISVCFSNLYKLNYTCCIMRNVKIALVIRKQFRSFEYMS